jgi:hypothetical protein
MKLVDPGQTPMCQAAPVSALVDAVAACDGDCEDKAWTVQDFHYALTTGSDAFGWTAQFPLLQTTRPPYESVVDNTCADPNPHFKAPPTCIGTPGGAGGSGGAGEVATRGCRLGRWAHFRQAYCSYDWPGVVKP